MSNVNDLKKSTFSGVIWKFTERMSASLITLVVSIILARMLTPEDYSIVGIVTIFFTIANVIISGGLNTALIQKKDSDIYDYSAVLYVSVLVSVVLYIILFFCAPLIARLYDQDILVLIIRVMGITLIINAVKSVLAAYLSNTLQFRKFFFSTIIGTVISAVVGITMAFKGYGPWALVAQQMISSVVDTLILFLMTRLRFVIRGCFSRLGRLFSYGWKIFVSSIISVAYDEINPLIIGLKYSGGDLAYYTKGRSFPNFINGALNDTVSSVLFPVMSKVQDDIGALLNSTRRFIRTSTFLIFPAMIGFMAVSDNFVKVILTEKWLPASVYIQIFCFCYMLNIIQNGNLQVMRALGRSDVVLILEIIKKSIYFVVILLFVFLSNNPVMLAIACAVNTIIATLVNTYPNRKLIGYRYRLQILDMLPNFITASIMGLVVYLMNYLDMNGARLLVLQILAGGMIYFILNLIIKNRNLVYLFDILKSFLRKKQNSKENS